MVSLSQAKTYLCLVLQDDQMQDLGLSEDHTEQVRLFMRFFRSKRETALRALESEFEDARSGSLLDDMYAKSDVEDILDGLKKVVKENFRHELSKDLNMTVLLLKQLFCEADRQGASLQMDLSRIEDQDLLEQVERMRLDTRLKSTPGPAKGAQKLVSLKDEHQRLQLEAARHEENSRQIQERFQRLQAQCSDFLREKAELAGQLERARLEMNRFAEEKGEEKGEMSADLIGLRRQLDEAQNVVKDLEDENNRRLNESKQFQTLRKLMASKNDEIRDLRKRLATYEPDTLGHEEES